MEQNSVNINGSGSEKPIIIKNIAVTLFVIAMFVGIVLLFYNMLYDETRKNIIKDGETAAMQTADKFDKYLSTNIDSIKLTAYTLDGMITEHRSDEEIQDFLVGQSTAIKSAVIENSTGLYGYINGRFFSGTNWIPPDDYIATERPWYTNAIAHKGEITILEPYIDVQSGNTMLALGTTLCDDVSVISVDISLDQIQKITEDSVTQGSSDIEMIINEKGDVIAHSDRGEVGKNYREETGTLNALILKKLNSSDSEYYEFDWDNSHYIVYSAAIQNDWHCLTVRNATSVFAPLTVILILTIGVILVIVITISVIMSNSGRRQRMMEKLGKQLSSTADIYISLHEINFITDTFSEVRNTRTAASEMIGNTRTHCQRMIRTIMEKFSDDSTREQILDFVDFSKLDERLKNRNTITTEFLSADNRWRRARYIVSGRLPDGRVSNAMYLIEDIDAEKRDRDKMFDTAKQLSSQLRSVANIYTSVHDVDIINNSFVEINITDSTVSSVIGNDVFNAQQVLRSAMTKLTDESCLKDTLDFIEFPAIEKNTAETGSATIEFLNSRGKWCRGRFIVSERTNDGRLSHVIWAVENIDSEKRARDKLTEAAQTLNNRISSIANIYMTVHELNVADNTFTEIRSNSDIVNDVIGGMHTHAQETLTKVMETVTDDSYIDEIRRFINLSTLDSRMRKSDTITIEYMNKDGLWRRGRFVASKREKNGKLARVMWLSEDIDTEKRERDKLIDMSERAIAASEAKSSFLSNMSHEIRTPINAVLGMNEMILRECSDRNILAYSESVKTAGNTLLGLVNDILDFSKIEAGKMEIIPVDYDLSSMINDLVNMIQTKADNKGLKLELEISKTVPKLLHGDEVRIKQIITNILTNAVKYTENGSVTFDLNYEKIPDEPDSVMLIVTIKDTGIGIKKEDMRKLFSEFERIEEKRNRNIEGTGLGMGITKRLLEMMGSSLQVESIYELGSKFSFELKQTVVKWEELGDYKAAYRASLGKRKRYHEKFKAPSAEVLVVDDTQMNLMVFKSLLKQTAVRIDTASSGNEGLSLAYDKKYDIIFLDHMMPEKDGIETLHEMRSQPKNPNLDTPTICLTANAISGAREKYLEEGFTDYLTKPIDSEKLENMLLEYLPQEKMIESDGNDDTSAASGILPDLLNDIAEIDIKEGIKNNADEGSYLDMLKNYAKIIGRHTDEIEKYMASGDTKNAVIKIHSLKSTSRIIGASDIGELAQRLEDAGKAGDTEILENELGELLDRCRTLGGQLSPLLETADENDLPMIEEDQLLDAFTLLKEYCSVYDLESITDVIEELGKYSIPAEYREKFDAVKQAADSFDYEMIPEILK